MKKIGFSKMSEIRGARCSDETILAFAGITFGVGAFVASGGVAGPIALPLIWGSAIAAYGCIF
jgi:hypothetical protein